MNNLDINNYSPRTGSYGWFSALSVKEYYDLPNCPRCHKGKIVARPVNSFMTICNMCGETSAIEQAVNYSAGPDIPVAQDIGDGIIRS